jgi:hypothetical protein
MCHGYRRGRVWKGSTTANHQRPFLSTRRYRPPRQAPALIDTRPLRALALSPIDILEPKPNYMPRTYSRPARSEGLAIVVKTIGDG